MSSYDGSRGVLRLNVFALQKKAEAMIEVSHQLLLASKRTTSLRKALDTPSTTAHNSWIFDLMFEMSAGEDLDAW